MGLDIEELFMAVEQEFEIQIPHDVGRRLETVALLYDYVCAHSPRLVGVAPGVYSGAAWDRLIALVAASAPGDGPVRAEDYFVRDLGMG